MVLNELNTHVMLEKVLSEVGWDEVKPILTGRLLRGPKPTDHDLFRCDGAATSAVRLLSFVPPCHTNTRACESSTLLVFCISLPIPRQELRAKSNRFYVTEHQHIVHVKHLIVKNAHR